ncbi:MAG: PA4642 family protein, partial [Alcanivorax nanhaiticus]
MAERKDKKKVIGEPMTDEQIKVFLDVPSEEGVSSDFHTLEKAYRAL